MAGKMSARAQKRMAFFDEAKVKVDRLYALIEQYATARSAQDQFLGPISRTAQDVSQLFMDGGEAVMGDDANQIAMLARRGGLVNMKARAFRELVGSIRSGVDTAVKVIIAEEGHREDNSEE